MQLASIAVKKTRKIKFIPGGAKSVPEGSNEKPENVSDYEGPAEPPKRYKDESSIREKEKEKKSKDEKKKPKKEKKSKAKGVKSPRSPSLEHQRRRQQLTRLDSLRYGGTSPPVLRTKEDHKN